MAPRLEGKRILITGASSGVGYAAIRRFDEEGARLAVLSRSAPALHEALDHFGVDGHVVTADLADREATEAAVDEAVAALGGLDVLVSNCGVAVFGHFAEVHPDDFDRTVAVTFTGAVNVIRAALPHLRESRGTLVATGSLMCRVPLPTYSSYAASKHALRGFLNSLRIEEREQGTGVDVAMVHPGPIDTPLFAGASTATGIRPRVPPDSYSADLVARALVEAAVERGPVEVLLGGVTRGMDLLFSGVRPAAEGLLVLIDRWYRSGTEVADDPGTLWEAPDRAQISGAIPSRDSLMALLQLGTRFAPSPATPFKLMRNAVAAGQRAFQLRDELLQRHPDGSGEPPRPLRRGEAEVPQRGAVTV